LAKRRGLVEGERHGFNATDGPTINILVEGQSPFEPVPNNTRAAGWCGWVVERREDAGVRQVKDQSRVSPQGVGCQGMTQRGDGVDAMTYRYEMSTARATSQRPMSWLKATAPPNLHQTRAANG